MSDSFWYSQPESERFKKVKTTEVCQDRYKTKYKPQMMLILAVISQYMITQPRQQFMDGHTLSVKKLGLLFPCFPLPLYVWG